MKEEIEPIINVLLVEDNEDDIVIMKDAFDDVLTMNIKKVVNDGVEAMAFLRKENGYKQAAEPCLIILDINMPKMNGFEVLEAVKSDQNLKHIPIVMLSTSNREEDIMNSYKKGASSYVSKPVDYNEFTEVIEKFAMYWSHVSKIPKVNK